MGVMQRITRILFAIFLLYAFYLDLKYFIYFHVLSIVIALIALAILEFVENKRVPFSLDVLLMQLDVENDVLTYIPVLFFVTGLLPMLMLVSAIGLVVSAFSKSE